MKVIGVEGYSFKDQKDSSKIVEGFTFHCATPIQTNQGTGLKTEKFSISAAKSADRSVLPLPPFELIGKEIFAAKEFNKVKRVFLESNQK